MYSPHFVVVVVARRRTQSAVMLLYVLVGVLVRVFMDYFRDRLIEAVIDHCIHAFYDWWYHRKEEVVDCV
jgi:hypothetical protein